MERKKHSPRSILKIALGIVFGCMADDVCPHRLDL